MSHLTTVITGAVFELALGMFLVCVPSANICFYEQLAPYAE